MKFDFKKDILSYIYIYIGFILIISIYFKPFVFDNKILSPNDIVSFMGTANEVLEYKKANTGEEVFWTNTSFGGMPNYLINMPFQDGNYTYFIRRALNPLGFFNWPIRVFFIGLISTYILFLSLKVDKYLGAIGSIAYVFGSFYFISVDAGHNSKVEAMYYAAIILAGFI